MGRGAEDDWALAGESGRARAASRAGVTYRTISSMDEIERMPGARGAPTPLAATDVRVERADARLGPVLTTVQDSTVPLATNGEFPPWPTMFFPLGTSEVGHICGHAVDTHLAYAAGARAEGVLSGPGGIPHGLLGYEPGAVEETARTLGVEASIPERGDGRAVCDPRNVGRVADLLRGFVGVARETDWNPPSHAALELRGRELLEAMTLILAAPASSERIAPRAKRNSHLIVGRAEEYARSRTFDQLVSAELCAAAGVSERRLRYAFQDIYGLSPLAYLRIRALHGVRRQLLESADPTTTVTRVAMDWGFWHLGRFSGQYRELFGERPSSTLRRGLPGGSRPSASTDPPGRRGRDFCHRLPDADSRPAGADRGSGERRPREER